MKNKIVFYGLTLSLIFLTSCSNESDFEKTSEFEKSNGTKPTSQSLTRKAGDGLYDVLGAGYDVTKEYANANSAGFQVIDIPKFKTEQAARLIEEFPYSSEYKEEYGENASAYSKMVSLKTDATSKFKVYGVNISSSFSGSKTSSNKFDAKYIYGSYNLEIKQRRCRFNATTDLLKKYLTPEFLADLNTKTPQQIVQDYGTHVLLDIYTGAKLDIMFQSETSNSDRTMAARIGVKVGVGNIFNVEGSSEVNTSSSSKNYNRKLHYQTRGGDPSKSLIGNLNLDQTNPTINISNWSNSSTPANSVLVDIGQYGLIYIYDLIDNPTKKAQIKQYVDQYIITNAVNLGYIPVNIYGFYNRGNSDHYYTVLNTIPSYYVSEGVSFKAFTYRALNTVPIYRYYNSGNGDHFYTKSSQTPIGYTNEGIEFYTYPNATVSLNGAVPIYRYYDGKSGDHYYTQSNQIPANYVSEGVEFYAIP